MSGQRGGRYGSTSRACDRKPRTIIVDEDPEHERQRQKRTSRKSAQRDSSLGYGEDVIVVEDARGQRTVYDASGPRTKEMRTKRGEARDRHSHHEPVDSQPKRREIKIVSEPAQEQQYPKPTSRRRTNPTRRREQSADASRHGSGEDLKEGERSMDSPPRPRRRHGKSRDARRSTHSNEQAVDPSREQSPWPTNHDPRMTFVDDSRPSRGNAAPPMPNPLQQRQPLYQQQPQQPQQPMWYPAPQMYPQPIQYAPIQQAPARRANGLTRFGQKLGNAAILGAGFAAGADLANNLL